MHDRFRRIVIACRLAPIFLIVFFLSIYKLTWRWIPISVWMAVFILGIIAWAIAELVLRYREGVKRQG